MSEIFGKEASINTGGRTGTILSEQQRLIPAFLKKLYR
jgi:hypothetical protein